MLTVQETVLLPGYLKNLWKHSWWKQPQVHLEWHKNKDFARSHPREEYHWLFLMENISGLLHQDLLILNACLKPSQSLEFYCGVLFLVRNVPWVYVYLLTVSQLSLSASVQLKETPQISIFFFARFNILSFNNRTCQA